MKKTFRILLPILFVAIISAGVVTVIGKSDLNVKGSEKNSSFSKTGDTGLNSTETTGEIIFGSYPQSRVTDSAIISKLDGVTKKWISYGYYSGTGELDDGNMKSSDYMQYADITYGGNKYRAVTFSEYRPYSTGYKSSPDNSYQNDNGYYAGNVYYFKYEPLKWRVLDASTGFVVCDSVIDSQAYQNTLYYSRNPNLILYNSKDCKNNASDWETSSLRKWLNEDFYNTAFNKPQQNCIQELTRDNKSKNDSKYDSNPTSDKITLLSYWDVINTSYGFNPSNDIHDTARYRKSTDYAQCQGVYTREGSSWWLRSPFSSYMSAIVDNVGLAEYSSDVNRPDQGVVPALNLYNLESIISEN